MSFLKTLWTDLVEKRLWPVALALVLALVAVPVLLGGGAAAPVAVAPPVGATGTTGLLAQVALDTSGPGRFDRLGLLRDPFRQPRVGPTGPTGPTSTATSGSTSPAPTRQDTGSSSAPTPAVSGPPPGPQPQPKPAGDPRDAYVAVVRFGAEGSKRAVRRLPRLTPLPSTEDPRFVDLGVNPQGKVEVLLSEGVTATGEGRCKPSPESCESVELEPGDTERFVVTSEGGRVARYQLDLLRIDER